MKLYPFIFIVALLLPLSALSQEGKSKKQLREEEKMKDFEAVQKLINSEKFVFNANKAFPQNGKSIDLTTNPGSLIINGDSVIADLPYFGRSFSGGYSNTDGGMKFSGKIENIQLKVNEKKLRLSYSFIIKDSGNNYQCFLSVTTANNSNLSITTANRSSISYNGRIVKFKEDAE